jgi:large subunit ribosomal protein L18
MYDYLENRRRLRGKRAFRVRKKLHGSSDRPRMSIFKSNRQISVQLIDDDASVTLLSYSTLSKDLKLKKSKESAKQLGEKIALLAKEKNIEHVILDRGYSKYHGLIAEFADAARSAGLKF